MQFKNLVTNLENTLYDDITFNILIFLKFHRLPFKGLTYFNKGNVLFPHSVENVYLIYFYSSSNNTHFVF